MYHFSFGHLVIQDSEICVDKVLDLKEDEKK
jgi:hypothetical protein